MLMKLAHTIPLFTILLLTVGSRAQGDEQPDPSLLTLQRIYAQRDFAAQGFSGRWLKDGSGLTTLEKSAAIDGGRDIVLHDPASGKKEILVAATELVPPGESAPLAIDDYAWSKNMSLVLIYTNSKRVWRQNTRGDYWVLDRSSRQLRKLGRNAPPSSLMFARLSPDGRTAAYVRERNIYVEDLRDGGIRQLTNTPHDRIINGTFDWVYEEELGLRDGFRYSSDGKSIAYWQIDTTGVNKFPLVNNTDSLYPRITWIPYPKVGQQNSACRVRVVDVDGGQTRWLDVPGDPRNHYIARMDWRESSGQLILQQLNRLQNTNRVMLADPANGKVTPLFTETDEAWVDIHDEMHWLADGERFTWISERDGWRHAYLGSISTGELKLITPGDFDVIDLLHVDETRGAVYFIASPDNAAQRYLFRGSLDGKPPVRISPADQPGTHSYSISPNGRWAMHTYSTFSSPPVTQLVSLPDHKTIRVLASNDKLRKKLARLKRPQTEFFRVESAENVSLDAWCIKPPDMDLHKKYPLLVYVYGEPAGQTVLDRWGGSSQLWHWMLAQRGYVVISIDNRGTRAPRGRAWRKSVYRNIGVLAPKEQAAAVRTVLAERPYLDAERVGVWGWSGGGSMSLNAIFKYPDLYKTAIAVAPVPNQRYYDTIYQERYMGLPGDNVEGFTKGSPINFAKQLRGNLLLIHGTGDDNCHYQTTEMLINELIRHNKPFTMMAYPNRTHAIRERKNTTLHLRSLMTRYLQDNLPVTER